MINVMHDIMFEVFKHLEITSKLDLDSSIKYKKAHHERTSAENSYRSC